MPAHAGGRAVSGLEPRVLVGTLLLGSGEEEKDQRVWVGMLAIFCFLFNLFLIGG